MWIYCAASKPTPNSKKWAKEEKKDYWNLLAKLSDTREKSAELRRTIEEALGMQAKVRAPTHRM